MFGEAAQASGVAQVVGEHHAGVERLKVKDEHGADVKRRAGLKHKGDHFDRRLLAHLCLVWRGSGVAGEERKVKVEVKRWRPKEMSAFKLYTQRIYIRNAI